LQFIGRQQMHEGKPILSQCGYFGRSARPLFRA
jgi:hypothetical protein